jgi:alpha-mannosidase
MLESSHPGVLPRRHSYATDRAGAVMVTAVKGSEDDASADLIVRAVETRGTTATSHIELPLVGRVLEERFGPSQIRTFRVPADPSLPVVEVDLIEWPLQRTDAQQAQEANDS